MPHDWFVPLTHFFFACQMFVHHISVMNSSPQLGASLLSFGPGKADGISQFHGTDYDHQCTRPSVIRFSNSCLHMRFNYFFLTVSFHFHFTCQRLPANYESAMRSFIIDSFRWPVSKTSRHAAISGCQRSEFFCLGFGWESITITGLICCICIATLASLWQVTHIQSSQALRSVLNAETHSMPL